MQSENILGQVPIQDKSAFVQLSSAEGLSVLALLGQRVETRLLQHECRKRNRSPAKQWDLSQTEVIVHKNWGCPWVTSALLCSAP